MIELDSFRGMLHTVQCALNGWCKSDGWELVSMTPIALVEGDGEYTIYRVVVKREAPKAKKKKKGASDK